MLMRLDVALVTSQVNMRGTQLFFFLFLFLFFSFFFFFEREELHSWNKIVAILFCTFLEDESALVCHNSNETE